MPILFIGIPLLAVVVLNIPSWGDRRSALWAVMAAAPIQVALAAWDAYCCLRTGMPVQSSFFGDFSVDLFSAVVLCIIGLISGVTVIVAHSNIQKSRFSFGNAMLLLMMGMNGVVMVRDVFSLYVFIEVTSTASFLLIAINKKRDGLEGAFKYYIMSAIATVLMLLSIVFLFALVGDTSFQSIAAYVAACGGQYSPTLLTALILFTVALCIKSGVVPFHTWVPDAHSSAPGPVSVMLAGVVIKVSGVYALMRIYRDVFLCNADLGRVLTVLGLVSIVVGALGALGQSDIKRMLAFPASARSDTLCWARPQAPPLALWARFSTFLTMPPLSLCCLWIPPPSFPKPVLGTWTKWGAWPRRCPSPALAVFWAFCPWQAFRPFRAFGASY